MKRVIILLICCLLLTFAGCATREYAEIAATTLPVYEFTVRLCEGTGLSVTRLVTESVSCLHDYSLNVNQVRAAEAAELIVISGAGLEEFMDDILVGKETIDASENIDILKSEEGRDHEEDPHIWLSPVNAMTMAENICAGLSARYPEHSALFEFNLASLLSDLESLNSYGKEQLADLSCRDLITFHDGFGYLADCYDLHILEAVEEESGAEASAAELKALITEVREHSLPAIFTETNGSTSAASVISRETGTAVHTLDMAMSGDSWFDAMYQNIDTLKEALE